MRRSLHFTFILFPTAVLRQSAFLTLMCLLLIFGVIQTYAQSTADTGSQSETELVAEIYEYKLENRPDPFTPFITEKAASASVDMDEIVDNSGPLTGMQLFEPSQLTLVALMKKGTENLAMVQDFTGKGYVITEGTKIGRRGVVKTIAPKSVIVEETASTRAGKKIITEVVMLLKKEGEE